MAPVEELALLEFDRSNKGASKQRRDQINAEIATMRDLLPLPESSRQRLSQLQIMSLTCVYIRKCNVLQKLFRSRPQETQFPDSLEFFQAMTGFLLVTTREGKLLYISENVTDYLGHSMVDMKTQGDSLYDIVDKRDHGTVQAQLMHSGSQPDKDTPSRDVSFFCRMNMSRTLKRQSGFGDVKVMHIRGHFMEASSADSACSSDSQSVFLATCSPLITPDVKENLVQNNTMVFKSVHKLDMTYLEVSKNGEYHLGCTSEDLNQKSWYSVLHPEDIHEAKEKHIQLIRSNLEIGCMFTVRLLRLDGSSFWVNTVMHVRQATLSQNEEPLIICVNQVIDAHEAYQIKVQGHLFSMYPSRAQEMWGKHLPAVTSPNQDPMSGQWVQQRGSNTLPVSGYTSDVPSYITHTGGLDMYPATCSTAVCSSRVNKPTLGYPLSNPGSFVQLDQLKAMLKRKIQGPQSSSCKPTKLARVSWDVNGSVGGSGYTEMDHGISHMEHYSHVSASSHVECQNQMMQVMQPENYRFGLMTSNKISLKHLNYQGVSRFSTMISEQVVPDLNVPESYLTPDPSPVSSPQPLYTTVKAEVIDQEENVAPEKPTVNILQALEKLAALPQANVGEKAQLAQRRKELPVFDAFEIDNFFENLNPEELKAKASVKMEAQLKYQVKKEFPEDQAQSENIPHFAALKDEKTSSTVCYQDSAVLSITKITPQPQVHPQVHPHTPLSLPPSYTTKIADAKAVLAFQYPDVNNRTASRPLAATGYKDMLVSSTLASSPVSTASQESIDDLLSYFSDDGMDVTPVHLEERSSTMESVTQEEILEAEYKKTCYKSFYAKKTGCTTSAPMTAQHVSEEFSPQSSISSLAGEDDLIVDSPSFALNMAMSVLGTQGEMTGAHGTDIKDQDVVGFSDELKLGFMVNSWGSPHAGSMDLIKHSQ